MLEMQLPFGGDDDGEEEREALQSKVCSGEWDFDPDCTAALEVIEGMLTVNPEQRSSLREVSSHHWLAGQVPLDEAGPVHRRVRKPWEEADLVGRMDY